VRSGPGEARTILLLHIISVRPSKQPLMVRTFLKVYMELGSYFLFLEEQIKDIIILKRNDCVLFKAPNSTETTSFQLLWKPYYYP
jgi:GTPase involved in cell partitioning and DNA repair